MTPHQCRCCVYWKKHIPTIIYGSELDKYVGICKRRSPVLTPNGPCWPSTLDEDWCGEWEYGRDLDGTSE